MSAPPASATVTFDALPQQVPVHKFNDIAVLGISTVSLRDANGKVGIRSFPLLPWGGIAGADFCEMVRLSGR